MPVDTPHRAYSKALPDVRKVRDFLTENVGDYVRKLPGHDDADYRLFADGAYYLPALGRTIEAFVGMVMSPEPVVTDAPDGLQPYLDDLTNDGEPMTRVASRIVEEVISSARCVGLVDYPEVDETDGKITRLHAEKMKLRAYATFYDFENVLSWRTVNRNGRKVLGELRLIESYEIPDPEDEWETECGEQIRVLDLHEGKYRVRIYRQFEKPVEDGKALGKVRLDNGKGKTETTWAQHGADFYPQRGGKPLDEIPAVMFGPSSLDPSRLDRPPLIEMVGISCSHLNNSAQREWALMWCGAPTLVVSGDQPVNEDGKADPIKIGSSTAMFLGEGASAALLQAGAESVGALKESMEEKRRDMAAVGARILIDSGSSQISTETARLERAGEHSVLAELANSVSDGLTKILRLVAEWEGLGGADKITVSLNTDFLPVGLQAGELAEWLAALQKGGIPLAVFLNRLQSRGVVDSEMTEEEWRAAIEKDADDLGLGEDDDDEEGDKPELDDDGSPIEDQEKGKKKPPAKAA